LVFILVLLLALVVNCLAATEVVKIVDPDNGAGTDYTSLSAWEAGEQKDLVTADEIAIAKCRCTSGSADTTAVTIDGWTTDADHYIKIWTDPNEGYRHDGKWNTSKYRLDTGPVSDGVITILENYVRLLGLQLKASGAGDCRGVCVNANGSDSEIRIGYCLIWMQPESGYYADGIRVSDEVNGAINVKVFNTIIWDCFSPGYPTARCHGIYNQYGTTYAYNVTCVNCQTGFRRYNYSFTVKNCLAKCDAYDTNYIDFDGTFTDASDYNASSDGTAPGANSRTNQTFTFVDETNDDFHLASDDAGAKDYGTDLSSDPNLSFTDDIDGETRSGTWDIGADEYVAAAVPAKVQVIIISKNQNNSKINPF